MEIFGNIIMEFRERIAESGKRPFLNLQKQKKGMVTLDIDVRSLKRRIAERNTTMEGMAMFLGIDRSTLYRKLQNGGAGVTVCEAKKMSRYLGLTYEESIRMFWRRSREATKEDMAKNILSSPF